MGGIECKAVDFREAIRLFTGGKVYEKRRKRGGGGGKKKKALIRQERMRRGGAVGEEWETQIRVRGWLSRRSRGRKISRKERKERRSARSARSGGRFRRKHGAALLRPRLRAARLPRGCVARGGAAPLGCGVRTGNVVP